MQTIKHKFVDAIPDFLEENVVYVSVERGLAVHHCVCGCKNEVVTPFSPTDWELHFDGDTISLTPSIGNWEFKCQSHYWIKNNEIEWSGKWSRQKIEQGRKNDKIIKKAYYDRVNIVPDDNPIVATVHKKIPLMDRIKNFFLNKGRN